jgi:hypothetical protein
MSSHPYSNCYHRRISKSTGSELTAVVFSAAAPVLSPSSEAPEPEAGGLVSAAEPEDNSDIMFRSSFFIGLSFYEFTPKIDLTPIVQNFLYRVCGWAAQTPSMDIDIKVPTCLCRSRYSTPHSLTSVLGRVCSTGLSSN